MFPQSEIYNRHSEMPLEPPPRWTGTFDELLGSQKVMGLSTFAADSEITEGTGALMSRYPRA